MKIELKNVSKYYNTNENITLGLNRISASFHENEIVAIVGESGSGKSTFLNVITQMDTYDEGEVFYNDLDLQTLTNEESEELRKKSVGFVFQNYNLIESHSVLENVMLPLILKGVNQKEAKERALKVIDEVGLIKRKNYKAASLSGGEKQRLVIARALIVDAPILACDEPTGNLDSKTGKEIIELIKKVSSGRIVFIVTHNYDEIKDIATRRLRFKDGNLIEDIKLQEVSSDKQIKPSNDVGHLKCLELFKMAFMNLIRTPKKTILTLFIFLGVAISMVLMYSTILTTNFENISPNYTYANFDPYRIVSYSKDLSKMDLEKISKIKGIDHVVTNSFYEDYSFVMGQSYGGPTKYTTYLDTNFDSKKGILYGNLPENDDEIIVSVDNLNENYFVKTGQIIGQYFYSEMIPEMNLKIVGVYSSSFFEYSKQLNYTKRTMVIHGTDYLMNYVKASLIASKSKISYGNQITTNSISITKEQPKGEINYYVSQDAKGIIQNENYSASLNLGGLQIPINKDINILSDTIYRESYGKLIINPLDFLEFFDGVYQVSVYAKNILDVNHIKNKLLKLDYNTFIPTSSGEIQSSQALNSFIKRVVVTVVVVLILIVLFFISYFVTSRVYLTKIKEYTLLRTIGASKRNILYLVLLELIYIAIFAFILIILFVPIINLIYPINVIYVYTYYEFYKLFIFLFVMILCALFVGIKFNHRVFKYSVQQSLKKEALTHD